MYKVKHVEVISLDETKKPEEKESEDTSEKTEKESLEEPTSEIEPSKEKTEEHAEEKTEESLQTEEKTDEKQITDEEAMVKPKDQEEHIEEEKPSEKVKEKPVKAEEKKEKTRKDRGPDFKYIVRISNTDIDGEKNVVYGLKSIKGINVQMATLIADKTGIDRYGKIGDLKESQIGKIQETINNLKSSAPNWMLNRRRDYDTGEDVHLIGSEIDMRLRDEINIMKKIRSYRGIRHERGLPVRGQRTRANSRKGLALGVSKKREQLKK